VEGLVSALATSAGGADLEVIWDCYISFRTPISPETLQ